MGLSILFVAIWASTAGAATSVQGPFAGTGNGYFATWLALLMSVLYFGHAYIRLFDNVHTKIHHHAITFLLAASIVELVGRRESRGGDRHFIAATLAHAFFHSVPTLAVRLDRRLFRRRVHGPRGLCALCRRHFHLFLPGANWHGSLCATLDSTGTHQGSAMGVLGGPVP